MTVAEQSKFFVNLIGGLNTDATDLTFPDNAATSLDNVDVFRSGEFDEIRKRKDWVQSRSNRWRAGGRDNNWSRTVDTCLWRRGTA